jgi:hypothetical protein
MSVFGEEGMKLLPLLSNFSGEIGTAQGQLGGMVDVMNRNAATFDAVSDKVDTIGGKFMEFAAGVLDKVAPALDAVTEALSRIDAAAIGQKFADMFTGGISAMQGFQAAVDAFKTGNIEGALSLLWESIKLQVQMTADSIYKNLSAAFSTSADIIGEIFRADGPAMSLIKTSFSMVGDFITEKLYSALSSFMESIGRLQMAEVFQYKAETAARAVGQALDAIPTMAQVVAIDAGDKLATMPEKFKENLNAAGSLFPGLEEKAAALAIKQEEVAAAAAKHAPAINEAIISTQALLEEEKKKLEAELASAKAKGDAAEKTFAQIESEIELNNAIASGNEKEVARLQEKQRQAELTQKIKDIEAEIPAIMADIIEKTGTSEETARGLANQLVASRIAALGVAENSKGIIEPLEDAGDAAKTVRQTMEDIKNAKMEASPQRLKERTIDARGELKDMADFIGEDLSQMELDDILDKLGLDSDSFKDKNEKLGAIEGALNDLGEADPADITPEVNTVGVNDRLEKVKEYLANVGKPDASPTIDQEAVKSAVDTAKKTIDDKLTKSPVDVTLNAEESIGKIREQLKEKIDLAIESSKGTEHLSNIDKLVVKIEELVGKIEGKLPMQALAY